MLRSTTSPLDAASVRHSGPLNVVVYTDAKSNEPILTCIYIGQISLISL